MSDKAKRLFVAVQLNVAATRKIADAIATMRKAAPRALRVAWVPPPNLHVTVKFLGWTRPDAVDALRDAVRAVGAAHRPFELGARGVGAFPTETSPRVLWVGLADASGELARIAASVEDAMEKLGFARETRAFSPHLTIGRVKEGKGAGELLSPYRETDFGTSAIKDFILFESVMRSDGSEYTPLASAPLGGT